MRKILFLCTGNSCRSQMAEAALNRLGEGRFEDPAEAGGSDEERMAVFRRVYDEILRRLRLYVSLPAKKRG